MAPVERPVDLYCKPQAHDSKNDEVVRGDTRVTRVPDLYAITQ